MPLLPNNDPKQASYAEDKKAIWREIRALWIASRKGAAASSGVTEMVFSYAGAFLPNVVSPSYRMRDAETAHTVTLSLNASGSTATTVDIKQNGSTVATVSIAASEVYDEAGVNIPLSAADALAVVVTSAGTGADSLTVVVRW